MQGAKHAANFRISIAGEKIGNRVFIQHHIGIGEDQHVAARSCGKLLHAMRLAAAAGAPDQRHQIILRRDQRRRFIGRSVIKGQYLQIRMMTLQHREIGELLAHHRRFIIGAEQERGRRRSARTGCFGLRRQGTQDQRVEEKRPEQRHQRRYEDQQKDQVQAAHQ